MWNLSSSVRKAGFWSRVPAGAGGESAVGHTGKEGSVLRTGGLWLPTLKQLLCPPTPPHSTPYYHRPVQLTILGQRGVKCVVGGHQQGGGVAGVGQQVLQRRLGGLQRLEEEWKSSWYASARRKRILLRPHVLCDAQRSLAPSPALTAAPAGSGWLPAS